MKRNFSGREISALLRGKMIPFKASDPLMQKRVRDAKKAYPDESIERSYFYPKREFFRIMREYRNKSLKYEEPREPVSEIEVPTTPRVRTASMLPTLPATDYRSQTLLPPSNIAISLPLKFLFIIIFLRSLLVKPIFKASCNM